MGTLLDRRQSEGQLTTWDLGLASEVGTVLTASLTCIIVSDNSR